MADSKENESLPWLDGHYKVTGNWCNLIIVTGKTCVMKVENYRDIQINLKYGDFGEADAALSEETGLSIYNFQLSFTVDEQVMTEHGVIYEDGKKIRTKCMLGVATYEWMTEEEYEAFLNVEEDCDDIEAPSTPYKIQPDNLGKFLWFTGAPGTGKSTTAQMFARDLGYVYYEADCFSLIKNPYVRVDAEDATMAQFSQKKLKGVGFEERRDFFMDFAKEEGKLLTGDYDKDLLNEFYRLLCDDIKKERVRIGGDWAIAQCVLKRDFRDFVRSQMGPDFMFVVLHMELEDQMVRIRKRHHGDEGAVEMMKKYYSICDPAGEDEENVINVRVSPDMSSEYVTKKVMEMLR